MGAVAAYHSKEASVTSASHSLLLHCGKVVPETSQGLTSGIDARWHTYLALYYIDLSILHCSKLQDILHTLHEIIAHCPDLV